MHSFDPNISDERVQQCATFLLRHPSASLKEIADEMDIGWTMSATYYRDAALRCLKSMGEYETVALVKAAMLLKAPPCTQSL